MYHLVFLIAGTLAAARHSELLGEEPEQEDVDNGQCIPIMCSLGTPPIECTRLCSIRKYLPTCTEGNFCLCKRLVGGSVELISPDEVEDQPPEESKESFSIFTIILPLTSFFATDVDSTPPPTPEPFVVNIHEGRLYWDFSYILSGLLLLMAALIIYELLLCRKQPTYDTGVVNKSSGTGVEEIKEKVFTA